MGVISMLKSLLGGVAKSAASSSESSLDSVEYQDFMITPAPIKNGGMYRVSARISKGEQSHHLIRADEMSSEATCIEISLRKAREMIDQQGDNIFSG